MSEFTFDMFDLDLTDEELAIILSEMGDAFEDSDLTAGTWEEFDLGSPW